MWVWKVTDTCQTQTADIYRTSNDPVCVIYEVNAIVKYRGRFSCWLSTGLSHHSSVPLHRSLHQHVVPCVPHITHKWAIEVFVFRLYIWQLWCLKSFLCKASVMSRRGRQTNLEKGAHFQERKGSEMSAKLDGGKTKRAAFCKYSKRVIFS